MKAQALFLLFAIVFVAAIVGTSACWAASKLDGIINPDWIIVVIFIFIFVKSLQYIIK